MRGKERIPSNRVLTRLGRSHIDIKIQAPYTSNDSSSTRSYLKIRIFGRDQGEVENQPTGILKYVEDLIRGLNAGIGRKDFFKMLLI